MTTDPENLPSLDDESLQALVSHYTGLKYKLTDNLRVRARLVELQDEQLKRQIESLGNYEPIGDDIKNQLNNQ
jgi:outer membrane receptor for ferrienterochelin and colicin